MAEAADRLSGVAYRTPVLTFPGLDERFGARLYFKCEHLQRVGAFKFRGAYNAVSRLSEETRARGILTYSSGNHASGLALAGQLLGAPVTIAMPVTASATKRRLALSYGAEIVDCQADDREEVGRRVAKERGLHIIPPYDHDDIIAGQGTAARELLEEVPDLDMVVTPVGGGGLLAGTALAVQAAAEDRATPAEQAASDERTASSERLGQGRDQSARRTKVFGAEPVLGNDAARSLSEGRIVALDKTPATVADGLRTRFIGERNFAVLSKHVDRIVTVTEDEILDALALLWREARQLVEPSSAVPLAGLMAGRIDARGQRVGIILSGGNCELEQVSAWVRERDLP